MNKENIYINIYSHTLQTAMEQNNVADNDLEDILGTSNRTGGQNSETPHSRKAPDVDPCTSVNGGKEKIKVC